jgi:xanthine/uracil permease
MIVIGNEAGFRMWWVMATLALLSCIAHAALYILIGVIFYRRTMAAAVLYTVIVEYGVSFVPALINKFTINYRLRGLLANWMGWDDVRSEAENVFGSEPSWTHLLVLAAITLTLLGVAMYRVERTEYPTQQEG